MKYIFKRRVNKYIVADLDLLRLIKDQFSEDRSNGLIDAIDSIDVASELAVRIIDLKIEKGILDEEED